MELIMDSEITSNTVVKMTAKGKKLLTLELDFETLAEFAAATKVFGARSNASLLHQQVMTKIREAKSLTTEDEFNRLVEHQKIEILKRSKRKALERKVKSGTNSSGKTAVETIDDKSNFIPARSGKLPTITFEEAKVLHKQNKKRRK